MNCKECMHYDICLIRDELSDGESEVVSVLECERFKDRSRFVELPIKPGEKIFYYDTAGHIYESTVTQLVYGASGFLIDSDVMFNSNLIGKRFFLTREAAEQALKERES